MKKSRIVASALALGALFGVAGVAMPAFAVTYTVGARSCNSGYEAQTVAYHRYTVTHGQFTGGSWSYTNKNNGASWSYSYDGFPSQSFTSGTLQAALTSEISSVVSTRCA